MPALICRVSISILDIVSAMSPMTATKRGFGANHPGDKHVAAFEFNLEELRNIEGWVPRKDGFRKEIVEAIEWLETFEVQEQEPVIVSKPDPGDPDNYYVVEPE